MTIPSTAPEAAGHDILCRTSGATVSSSVHRIEAVLTKVGPDTDFGQLVGALRHTPFQSALWLAAWFDTIGRAREVQGFWLSLRSSGGEVLAMPIVLRRDKGLRVIEFPDCGVSDYGAPLLGASALAEAFTSPDIWKAILTALPACDLLRLERVPAQVEGIRNPLADHAFALPSRISGWSRALPQQYEAYFAKLSSNTREKIQRCRRRFGRVERNSTRRVQDIEEALHLMPQLSAWQAVRMDEKGREYELDDAAISLFYSRLIKTGLKDGHVVMMHLEAEGEPVALNFSFRVKNRLVYLRVGSAFGKWASLSPGILATHAAISEAQTLGISTFDFGAGDYEYKARFGGTPEKLQDISIPLSLLGWSVVIALQARRRLSRIDVLRRLVNRVRGKRSNVTLEQ